MGSGRVLAAQVIHRTAAMAGRMRRKAVNAVKKAGAAAGEDTAEYRREIGTGEQRNEN